MYGWSLMPGAVAGQIQTDAVHGCQMAIAKFLERMCLALLASGLWLSYATLQNLPSCNLDAVPSAVYQMMMMMMVSV